jgi:anti-anti-sigma regulatory factor
MLRLTVQKQTNQEVILAIYGKIAGSDVELLAREGRSYQQQARQLVLELDGVQFIDEAGLDCS